MQNGNRKKFFRKSTIKRSKYRQKDIEFQKDEKVQKLPKKHEEIKPYYHIAGRLKNRRKLSFYQTKEIKIYLLGRRSNQGKKLMVLL